VSELELKARCFDLMNQERQLVEYLTKIAQVLNVHDVNDIYPSVVALAKRVQELEVSEDTAE
jgi:hypothetical protein